MAFHCIAYNTAAPRNNMHRFQLNSIQGGPDKNLPTPKKPDKNLPLKSHYTMGEAKLMKTRNSCLKNPKKKKTSDC